MAIVFRGCTVLDGVGGRCEEALVVVEKERITRVGGAEDVIGENDQVIDLAGMTLMPGLIDSHIHLSFPASGDPLNEIRWSIPYRTAVTIDQARCTLQAGFTSIRDAGAPAGVVFGVREAINAGIVQGPRVKAPGSSLVITGGHGDLANGFPDHVVFAHRRTVDGVEECRKAARDEIRQGADCIKLMATGGVMSRGTRPTARGLSEEEMRAAIDEAHNVGIKTFAHAQANRGIKNALRAGIDSIEHGVWLDDEAIEMMLKNGTFLVPTLAAPYYIAKNGRAGGIPEHAVVKAAQIIEDHMNSFQLAYKAGVNIAMGTDAGTPFNKHGLNAYELVLMVQAGMTAMDAIGAATSKGAQLLDIDAGIVAEGKLADLIVVDGDPLQDIALLTRPEKIRLVMKDGEVVKSSF